MPGFPVFFPKGYVFREQERIDREGKKVSIFTTDEHALGENPLQSTD